MVVVIIIEINNTMSDSEFKLFARDRIISKYENCMTIFHHKPKNA